MPTIPILRGLPVGKLIKVAREVWNENRKWDLNRYYDQVAKRVTEDETYGLSNSERKFLADMLLIITQQDD